MNDQQRIVLLAAVLFMTVMVSAIGMVYSKHKTRMLFVEMEQLNKEVVNLNTEWGRLQLEQSAWSDHSRIERIARDRLGMAIPEPEQVAFIRP